PTSWPGSTSSRSRRPTSTTCPVTTSPAPTSPASPRSPTRCWPWASSDAGSRTPEGAAPGGGGAFVVLGESHGPRRGAGDPAESVPFQDRTGVLGGVTVDECLPQAQRRGCSCRSQGPVDPATAPLRERGATPDAREVGPGHWFEATAGDDLPRRLGDPQFHAVVEGEPVQQSVCRCSAFGNGVA